MNNEISCFTAYDIRGRIPNELNEELAARIALAFCDTFSARFVVVGRDMRLSSPVFAETIITALTRQGVKVYDLGLCGTEEVYHAVFSMEDQGIDGGIMITASHNPADYNGMKIVRQGARPVSGESGLLEMKEKVSSPDWFAQVCTEQPQDPASCTAAVDKQAYIDHLLGYVDRSTLRPLKIVVNAGNGCAGPIIDLLEPSLPFSFIRLHHEPDGSFPNGVPNPLLPEKREATAQAVREHQADLGIAWDGDFDRCFLYDEQGRFIEGYYIVGLLAEALLASHPGSAILHDPRLVWNTVEVVNKAGGQPVLTRTGHAFIKENMRAVDGLYGGEMSAHHYFRDFGYCDSGMIPWLLVAELMAKTGKPLSAMVDARMQAFPVSGEINSRVQDPDQVISTIERQYGQGDIDYTDGISVEFPEYRFNLRKSNTEPVLRLNVETRGNQQLLEEKTADLLALIRA